MRVINTTTARHVCVPMKDKAGREHCAAILKYTFLVGPSGVVDPGGEESAEVDLADTYNGEDGGASSIRRPSQLFEFKPGTDVILIGHAHAPPRANVTHVDVSLRFGPVQKTVRAHGLRAWQAGSFGGLAPSAARPIREPVPLIYELAWGGLDLSDPERFVGEARNTVGRGVARDPSRLIGEPAAQIEYPSSPIGGGENVPAGVGAIHRHWQPRAGYAGTYDQAWMDTKMPLLPNDFDPRFHVSVPHDQWSPTPLRGDEPCEVRGATVEGVWRFQLPRVAPGFSAFIKGERSEYRTHLDTVLLDADQGRVELTFRAAIPMPRKYEMLEDVMLFEKKLV